VAKVGLDGHEAGAKLICRILRDDGMEVIYLGTKTTTQQVTRTASDEDVDLIGISLLSGIHLGVADELMAGLQEADLAIPVVFGGVIPPADAAKVLKRGIAAVFGPGSNPDEIVSTVRKLATQHSAESTGY
jgi:methylmalonyl-CoA mutase C-terminal domain/subunit